MAAHVRGRPVRYPEHSAAGAGAGPRARLAEDSSPRERGAVVAAIGPIARSSPHARHAPGAAAGRLAPPQCGRPHGACPDPPLRFAGGAGARAAVDASVGGSAGRGQPGSSDGGGRLGARCRAVGTGYGRLAHDRIGQDSGRGECRGVAARRKDVASVYAERNAIGLGMAGGTGTIRNLPAFRGIRQKRWRRPGPGGDSAIGASIAPRAPGGAGPSRRTNVLGRTAGRAATPSSKATAKRRRH